MPAAPLAPVDLQPFGAGELAIRWNDGGESYLPLEAMRRACPCAACSGEPDALGRLDRPPERLDPPRSFQLTGVEVIGGYALRPTWADGHGTGLYPFPLLRRLGGGEPDHPAATGGGTAVAPS